jgi:prefoldin subunit 5
MSEKLTVLEEEYRKGQKMLAELDERRGQIRDTLLRISGAIQVLRELGARQDNPELLAVSGAGD